MGILCHFTCKSNEKFENKFEAMDRGENGQIAHFCKLCCNLPLFWKYLAIFCFFSTRVLQTQVPTEFAYVAVAELEFCTLKMPPGTQCH